jgi:hypothetical protein
MWAKKSRQWCMMVRFGASNPDCRVKTRVGTADIARGIASAASAAYRPTAVGGRRGETRVFTLKKRRAGAMLRFWLRNVARDIPAGAAVVNDMIGRRRSVQKCCMQRIVASCVAFCSMYGRTSMEERRAGRAFAFTSRYSYDSRSFPKQDFRDFCGSDLDFTDEA